MILLILALTASVLQAEVSPGFPDGASALPNAANAQNNSDNQLIPAGLINSPGVDVDTVIETYAQLVGKTYLRVGLPSGQMTLETDTPLTRADAIQALQAVLRMNGIAVIDLPGGKFIRIVPVSQASQTGEPSGNSNQLPELGSYLTRIVLSKYVKPSQVLPIIQPLSKSPNSILPIDADGILVLHDNAKNVGRMAETIKLANFLYQAGNDSTLIRMWQGLDTRIGLAASHQKTPGKNFRNVTASAQ